MLCCALATDYDGTLATNGKVDEQTLSSLHRFLSSGRKLLLITGRELPDLKQVFPQLSLFTLVIAENGGLLYRPATGEEDLLCAPVSLAFVNKLRREGISISVGRTCIATVARYHDAVQNAIAESGLNLRISLNKGSVMVLPAEVNKASGLRRTLAELELDAANVVGIGDGENDGDFLKECGYAVAVANAVQSVKLSAHVITVGSHGAGLTEIIDRTLADDLPVRSDRHGQDLLIPD